jgi:1,4-dihydroxy-2-naphthoate octaprenyltransferase
MGNMPNKLFAFIRLARPQFLIGGFLLYALGALIARYGGYPINFEKYWVGQLYVSAIQLMTHFLNEYWDVETDRLNKSRTPFSGGSGVLALGGLQRDTAFTGAVACIAVASAAAIWLIVETGVSPGAWAIMALGFLGAYYYSSPPLRLAATGYGELSASVVVAAFVPALGHILQAERPSLLVLLTIAPLIVFHFAMLLAFEFPDFLADEAAGKHTLLVRVGRRQGAAIHNVALLVGLGLAVAGTFFGLPARVAVATIISTPLIYLQITNIQRMQHGEPVSFTRVTFLAVLILMITAYFMAFTYWVLGS